MKRTTGQRVSLMALLAGLVAAGTWMSLPDTARAQGVCSMDWKPVCGKIDNWQRTYSNECWAKASKAKILYKGECKWK